MILPLASFPQQILCGDTTDPPQRRDLNRRRYKAFWLTELRAGPAMSRAHILNISCTGAKIHAETSLVLNDTLDLRINDVWYSATVRWRVRKDFGIKFDQELTQEIVFVVC